MALSANTQTNSEGIAGRSTFFVTTDSTSAVKTYFHCGFVPRYIRFVNLTDRIQDEWVQGMTADYSLHTVANGTVTYATSGGITQENGTTVTVANSVVMSGTNTLAPASGGSQIVNGFSVPAALMVASKDFMVIAEA